MSDPVTYFEWTQLLAIALGRRALSPGKAAVATFVAMNCRGITGVNAYVDAARIALELDMSERQVWRHVTDLVDGGWFEQTQKPTRGSKGHGGRRARYRLTRAHLFTSHDSGLFRVTEPAATTSHENTGDDNPEPSHDSVESLESSDTLAPNRLTLQAESSDIATPENVAVLRRDCSTTDGTTGIGGTEQLNQVVAREDSIGPQLARNALRNARRS